MPKEISHGLQLRDSAEQLASFANLVDQLGAKGGPWLLQLPPSLSFKRDVAKPFFKLLRSRFNGGVVCEPRHASWFEPGAEKLLCDFEVSRAAASPARVARAAIPGGSTKVIYYRLHGTPRVYYSAYDTSFLKALAASIREAKAAEAWCVFDNTASGAAIANALEMKTLLGR